MSKWALWAAHRYVHAGAAVPRRVGPDGKLLARPWRQRSERAEAAARVARASRPQPIWPRPLGLACLGLAAIAALDPIGPMPTHVAASSSAGKGAHLTPPRAVAATGASGPPVLFRWVQGDCTGPFQWVLLDASYQEVVRLDVADRTAMVAPREVHERLETGGTWHWYVLGDGFGRPVASPVQTFRIR